MNVIKYFVFQKKTYVCIENLKLYQETVTPMSKSKLFLTKSIGQLMDESKETGGLKRSLSALNLTTLGIGAIIGAGIFVLTGQAAAQYAGPAMPSSHR